MRRSSVPNAQTTLKAKDQARSYRMQTMTAHKGQTSTNLLNSNIKQQQNQAQQNQQSKSKFELPMLSNRSNSRQALGQTRTLKDQQNGRQVSSASLTSSQNFLPSRIASNTQMPPTILTNAKGPSMGRHYQTCSKEPTSAESTGSVG